MALSQKQQVSVTRRMMYAGVHKLAGFNADLDSITETVAKIYRAMETERRHSNPDDPLD